MILPPLGALTLSRHRHWADDTRHLRARAHTSLVMATIIPISTNTTIATCSQIHVGDMNRDSLL
jgi:hypothetical protein